MLVHMGDWLGTCGRQFLYTEPLDGGSKAENGSQNHKTEPE